MSGVLELAGWVVALGALAAAAGAYRRMAAFAEAVARACHEVRGPLTAARLGLGLAFRSGQPAEARLRGIELELRRAALVLDDLSEVWRRPAAVRWSEAASDRQAVDLAQLLADSVEAWREAASARGARLRLLASSTRPVVCGEPLRLAQAIGNLLANAVEHGGGLVQVSCRRDGASARIEVCDEGPGLPAPVAELAARPCRGWLALAPHSRRRRQHHAGSRRGHGLAVASAIASAHGGRLSVAPSERGARLVLELPRAEADAGVPAAG